jgi:hypothetical protein
MKNLDFIESENLTNKLEVIYYYSAQHKVQDLSKPILALEAIALLASIARFRRYLGGAGTKIITDNKALYFLFSSRIWDSSVKIRRYAALILSEFPGLSFKFTKGCNNMSDYLSRGGYLDNHTVKKCQLKDFLVKDFPPPPDMTAVNWAKWVAQNDEYLIGPQMAKTSTIKLVERCVDASDNGIYPDDASLDYMRTVDLYPEDIKINYVTAMFAEITRLWRIVLPVRILREKLTRSKFIEEQHKAYPKLMADCLASDGFVYHDGNIRYELQEGLLIRFSGEGSGLILTPASLIGCVLAISHLFGHMGPVNLANEVKQTYYISNLVRECRKFTQLCYPCFLSTRSTKKHPLGQAVITETRVFESVCIDFAEDQGRMQDGRQHILVAKCPLTGLTQFYPCRSKTSDVVIDKLLYGIVQCWGVPKNIWADNAPCFRSAKFLAFFRSLGCWVRFTNKLSPHSRGQAERAVGVLKTHLKKLMRSMDESSYDWLHLPALLALEINGTKSAVSGYKPSVLATGHDHRDLPVYEHSPGTPMHPRLVTHKMIIRDMAEQLKTWREKAKNTVEDIRKVERDRKNKTSYTLPLSKGDIVFLLDKSKPPVGMLSKPLRPVYNESPWIVLKSYNHSAQCARLADGFLSQICADHIKKFEGSVEKDFPGLPQEVIDICGIPFEDWDQEKYDIIARHDKLKLPDLEPDYTELDQDIVNLDPENLIDDDHLPALEEPEDEVDWDPSDQTDVEPDVDLEEDEGDDVGELIDDVDLAEPTDTIQDVGDPAVVAGPSQSNFPPVDSIENEVETVVEPDHGPDRPLLPAVQPVPAEDSNQLLPEVVQDTGDASESRDLGEITDLVAPPIDKSTVKELPVLPIPRVTRQAAKRAAKHARFKTPFDDIPEGTEIEEGDEIIPDPGRRQLRPRKSKPKLRY